MELERFMYFITSTIIMIALPGPSVLLTIAHSISFGWKRALLTVLGATFGIAIQLTIAIMGIGTLIRFMASIFEVVRWVGAGYLVYIGISIWINAKKMVNAKDITVKENSLFVQGLLITVLNPKSIIFISAFLPQFIDLKKPLNIQLLIIVPCFLTITFFVTSIWAIISGSIVDSRVIRFDPAIIFRVASLLIIATGISMIYAY